MDLDQPWDIVPPEVSYDDIVGIACDADFDNDGVPDSLDNAPETAPAPGDPNQIDTDIDQYGNLCDGDLNNDRGVVDGFDYGQFAAAFPPGIYDPSADFNSIGDINWADYGLFTVRYGVLPPWY